MMIRNASELGALIRDSRANAGWDQQELADRAGVGRLWVIEVERGKPGAGIGRILNTLATLGVELHSRSPQDDVDRASGPTSADLMHRVLAARSGSDG